MLKMKYKKMLSEHFFLGRENRMVSECGLRAGGDRRGRNQMMMGGWREKVWGETSGTGGHLEGSVET